VADREAPELWLLRTVRSLVAHDELVGPITSEPGVLVFYLVLLRGGPGRPKADRAIRFRECVLRRDVDGVRRVLAREGVPLRASGVGSA
jgi:hypothetical protein